MIGINQQQAERESQRMQANRNELIERITRVVPEDGVIQPLEGLSLARASMPLERVISLVKPSFCVIAQGSKEVFLGNSRYRYDPSHYLIATVELPWVSQILDATSENPYLSFRLELTPALVDSVMTETGYITPKNRKNARAMDVSWLDVNLQDAVLRLARLLDSPAEAPALMPLITREIVYRLLIGEQGDRLRHLVSREGYTPLISRAIERLHQQINQSLHIEVLARELGMSVSGLHHRFKAVTGMSPLQYQKQLRLHEARRLMLNQNLDAASAGYHVGYHSATQFNREYKSLFGVPPIRDVQRFREVAMGSSV